MVTVFYREGYVLKSAKEARVLSLGKFQMQSFQCPWMYYIYPPVIDI